MRYNNEEFKVYVGKSNSLPRRLREYSNKFQPGVRNGYKLRHFQFWLREKLPGSVLDLYAVLKDDNLAVETEVCQRTEPLINERVSVSSRYLQDCHFEYYKSIFETKFKYVNKYNMAHAPSKFSTTNVDLVDRRISRLTNHEMIAKALQSYSGQQIETQEFNSIFLKSFPNFGEGSLRPNDHAGGNKGDCPCAGTEGRLLDRIRPGLYRVG